METAIKLLKEKLANETSTINRCAIKECIHIVETEYLKTLSPTKAIETINQYIKEA